VGDEPQRLEVVAGRYELVRLLGSGTSCDVYEAIDRKLGSRVALKRFREASLDALRQIKREFRALDGVHIPGLVQFYDLVVEDGAAFFTMELVDGKTLRDWARGAGRDDLRDVLGRAARTIGELHACNQLHRDVKPTNIMVTTDGDIRVLDFGLASAAGAAGTPAYMAPEQLIGRPASTASDWYSFGALLYELLAGQVPTEKTPADEHVLRKQRRRFPTVCEVKADAPADLGDLAWALLEPDPAKRPGPSTIAGVLGFASTEPASARRADLFGRSAELGELADGLARALAGRPTVILVEGESGIGKSSLVRAFLAGERARCIVLASAARPQESVPLRAIDAMVDELASVIERLPESEREAFRCDVSRELVRAFPVLGGIGAAPASAELPGDGADGRREAQLALARVLCRLAERRPVVLWIDDLQWADYESTLFLEAAVSGASAARLLVVLARRPIALPWPDREAWLDAAARIRLRPLDDEAARALLAAHAARHAMTEAAVAGAMREARGNAFLLEFLARHTLRGDARAVEIEAALGAALDGLDRDARVLFECVALTQQPVPLAYLGRVLADRAQLRRHTARLSSEGLISMDERDRVRPYHDALRERAEAGLDAATRRARHGLLATALDDAEAPIEWRIPHLEGSGQLAAAAHASSAAGRAAAARYAYEIAAAYFEKALALAELEPPERVALLEALATNLAAAGNGRSAAQRYDEAAAALRSIGDPREALRMQHGAAIALLRSGAIDAGVAALKEALDGLGERLPRMAVAASLYEVLRLALSSRAPDRRELTPRVEMRLETLWTSATTLSMYEPFVAHALTLRLLRHALAAGQPRWTVRALALEAAFVAGFGGPLRARAESMMADLRRRAAEVSQPYEDAWVAATEGSTAWLSGDVQRSYEQTSRARELFRRVPETGAYDVALLDSFRLPAMSLLGLHDAVLRSAEDVLAAARTRGDGFATLPCLHGHITLAYLATGDVARAVAAADEADEIARQASSPLPAYHHAWSLATIALFRGDGEQAHRVITGAWGALRRSHMLRLEAVAGDLRYLRARCALAAARAGHRVGARLRDAMAQARWLRRSTLAHGRATADAIEAQVAAFTGRDPVGLAAAGSAALRRLGLALDADALDRWSSGRAALPIDRVYVV
jgi:eukaryotic-like serine/threonine-protein kinase